MLDWNSTLLSTVAESSNAIAHDMRTPISRIRMKLSTICERPDLDKETRKQLQQNIAMIDKIVVMFDNILNIAKAESRAGTEFFEDVDIRQLVQDVIEFHESIFEDKQIKLTCSLPDTPVYLRGDKQLLGQAFVNLIDNAAKYTPEAGHVAVSLTQQNSEIRLTVADNGGGMPDELLEKAKDRFFRADRSRHTHGFGLGLSLVNAVAALHNGRLALRNADNGLQATIIFGQVAQLKVA